MKKILYLFLVVSLFVLQVKSQNSQSLILVHNVAGISQMNAIANPSRGNIVYVVANSTMYQYNGLQWLAVGGASSPSGWGLTGNAGTNPTNNLLGTTDNQDLSIGANNQAKIVVKATNNRLLFPKIIFNPNAGVFNSGVIGIDESTTGRLRITAGDSDTYNNSLGASIDLHGNSAPSPYAGRLDLVAGSGASNTNQGINFYTSNNLRATMLGDGHFGINTASPTELFHIHGTGPNFRYVDGSQGSGKVLTSDANGVASWQTPSGGGGTAGWGLNGNAGTSGNNNYIGTSDAANLEIATNGITRLIVVNQPATDHRILFPKVFYFPNSNSEYSAVLGINGTSGRLRITAGDDDTFDNSLGASVDLHGNNAENGFEGRLDLVAGSGANNTENAINIFTGNTLRATFLGNGNFGINDPNPSLQLVVNGSAGKTGGGNWTTISDRRLKRNINPYKKGLSEILKVEPVNFQYNNKSNAYDLDKIYVGVIAQEIEKVLPGTVTTTKDRDLEDMRTFDSSELTWTMINAIKELNKKIELLEKKIIELQE
ncbi:tail fiber domain-containing protein [Flavobacteriales bacterium]|nr:tail fiber domain-containing protein [Flavobacteriales bacterium]